MVMYLGGITKYTIIAWILANWNKWCAWGEWELKDGTHLLRLSTNILYHHVVASLSWLSFKKENVWNVYKSNARRWQILQRGWHSHLPFCAKVFIWRVIVVGLPLRSSLKRRWLGSSTCFFCNIPLEGCTHRFIKCSIT